MRCELDHQTVDLLPLDYSIKVLLDARWYSIPCLSWVWRPWWCKSLVFMFVWNSWMDVKQLLKLNEDKPMQCPPVLRQKRRLWPTPPIYSECKIYFLSIWCYKSVHFVIISLCRTQRNYNMHLCLPTKDWDCMINHIFIMNMISTPLD